MQSGIINVVSTDDLVKRVAQPAPRSRAGV